MTRMEGRVNVNNQICSFMAALMMTGNIPGYTGCRSRSRRNSNDKPAIDCLFSFSIYVSIQCLPFSFFTALSRRRRQRQYLPRGSVLSQTQRQQNTFRPQRVICLRFWLWTRLREEAQMTHHNSLKPRAAVAATLVENCWSFNDAP